MASIWFVSLCEAAGSEHTEKEAELERADDEEEEEMIDKSSSEQGLELFWRWETATATANFSPSSALGTSANTDGLIIIVCLLLSRGVSGVTNEKGFLSTSPSVSRQ